LKPLLVFGERPGPNTDPNRPLFPHTTTGAAANLIRMLGISQEEYLAKVTRYNVVDNHHTSSAAPCVREKVWERMAHHITRWGGDARIVFLGRSAAYAGPEWVRILPWGVPQAGVMVIPHPSGRNRFYNSLASKEFIVQALRKFVETC
jgi:hypothetical protein